jgi:hypothetical protein
MHVNVYLPQLLLRRPSKEVCQEGVLLKQDDFLSSSGCLLEPERQHNTTPITCSKQRKAVKTMSPWTSKQARCWMMASMMHGGGGAKQPGRTPQPQQPAGKIMAGGCVAGCVQQGLLLPSWLLVSSHPKWFLSCLACLLLLSGGVLLPCLLCLLVCLSSCCFLLVGWVVLFYIVLKFNYQELPQIAY